LTSVEVAKKDTRPWQRLRKQANTRRRRWLKRAANAGAAVTSLWLRFEEEATHCPACESRRLALLDVMRVRGDMTGRRLTFLTGCEGCGLLFCNPLPRAERLEGFYGGTGVWAEAHAERAAHILAVHQRRMGRQKKARPARRRKRAHLIKAMEPHFPVDAPPPGAKAIDFGCGEGKLLNWLQDFGWDTYGIEPSTEVAFLRHRRLDAPPQDGTFDFAILHHVLEHVVNPLDVLRQLAGALRDGGMLFVSVPRIDTLAQHGDFHYCINGRNHLVGFTEACLRALLARAGFEVAAVLDDPELDRALTEGQPLRLRVLARRSHAPARPPEAPLDAARRALTAYTRAHQPIGRRLSSRIPSRLKGGWMQWSLMR
jgi:2-polyprenyl-3-methyl-5-hydroxy-6-metoxy-1,4-benzoquinol methylase